MSGHMPPPEPGNIDRPLSDAERDLRSAHEVVFLLVQRLGGEVELTAEELSSLDPSWELVTWHNPVTMRFVLQCRKPTKEQQ